MEYKGYGGSKLIIDGNSVTVKELLQKETCDISEIRNIEFKEPSLMQNGSILITMKVKHTVIFLKKNRDTFFEAYQTILPKVNAAMCEPDFEPVISKKVGRFMLVDETNKIVIFKVAFSKYTLKFTDIIDYELIEDDSSVMKGAMGKSLVGGVLFGGVGAIVGSTGKKTTRPTVDKMQLIIRTNNIKNPNIIIDLINSQVKKSSSTYTYAFSEAQEAISVLNILTKVDNNRTSVQQNSEVTQVSGADEIVKYKNLLDSGIITQDEFDSKKKQLLGL